MAKIIKISNDIFLGKKNDILIIPEIGINHFGNLEKAKKIVLSAKKAGAKVIKVQVHIPDKEMSLEAKRIKPGNSNLSIYDVISKNCLKLSEEKKLKKFIEDNDLLYMASCFCIEAADFLNEIGTKIFKVGSGECNHFPLLEHIAKFKKPMIVSTGMHTINEINRMIVFLKRCKAEFAINHCVNLYPTPLEHSNLYKLKYLIKKYSKTIPIGLSDHARGLAVCYASLPLGINMIEKHFVINKKKRGPDVSASLDFCELKELIKSANEISYSLNKKINVIQNELVTKKFAFHSAVSKFDLKKNDILTKDNIVFKRPGNGDFLAKNFKFIYNKKIKKSVKQNSQMKKNHL
jgi:N-acetylneuraminate synthase